MEIPTRREFFRYAVGATLVAELPLEGAEKRLDVTTMPLVVDLIGPMAFKKGQNVIDVWMPKLGQMGKKHEAGIGTSVTSIELPSGDYVITGPTPYAGDPRDLRHFKMHGL